MSTLLMDVRENEEAISHIRLSPCMTNASLSRLKINAWYNMSPIKQEQAINWHTIHQLLLLCMSVCVAKKLMQTGVGQVGLEALISAAAVTPIEIH